MRCTLSATKLPGQPPTSPNSTQAHFLPSSYAANRSAVLSPCRSSYVDCPKSIGLEGSTEGNYRAMPQPTERDESVKVTHGISQRPGSILCLYLTPGVVLYRVSRIIADLEHVPARQNVRRPARMIKCGLCDRKQHCVGSCGKVMRFAPPNSQVKRH